MAYADRRVAFAVPGVRNGPRQLLGGVGSAELGRLLQAHGARTDAAAASQRRESTRRRCIPAEITCNALKSPS